MSPLLLRPSFQFWFPFSTWMNFGPKNEMRNHQFGSLFSLVFSATIFSTSLYLCMYYRRFLFYPLHTTLIFHTFQI
jgi:hypothetical protein